MQVKNKPLFRYLEQPIKRLLNNNYSGLVKNCLQQIHSYQEYPLQNPSLRIELETNPSRIIAQIKAADKKHCVFSRQAEQRH